MCVLDPISSVESALNAATPGERPLWARRIEKARSERGWSFARAAFSLRKRDPRMPDTATIAKYWAQRWESGEHKPGDRYRRHLCALLGLAHELFDDEDTAARLVRYPATGGVPGHVGGGSIPAGEELVVRAARESADYGRRHGTSNVHEVSLEQFDTDVRELAADFLSLRPVPVVLRARAMRDQTFDLLDGRQWPRQTRDLHSVAGRLCGLLAVASSDFFGRYDAAGTQCRTAWLCAEMSDNNELRAWVRALQSGVALWAGRWKDAAALAEQAREYSRTGPSAVRAAVLQARALARLGDTEGVDRAVAESEAGWDLPDSPDTVGVMGFSEANRMRCAGTAYLWLGASHAAQQHLENALASYEADDPDAYAHMAVTRADLASTRLEAGDVDGAAETLQSLLSLAAERRMAGVARRISGLRTLLARPRYRNSPAAQDLAQHIEQFRTGLAVLAAGDN